MTSKIYLRKEFKNKRAALSQKQIEEDSISIANNLLQLDIWDALFYHLFLSIEEQKEVQTDVLLHVLQGKDKNVVVSKSNFKDYTMSHFLLTDQTRLLKNKYHIPEPQPPGLIPIDEKQIDVVFIPLLAADFKGNRIGYGKGFYDRFLAKCRPEALKIGLSFFEPHEEEFKVNKNDQKLDFLVSPFNVYAF